MGIAILILIAGLLLVGLGAIVLVVRWATHGAETSDEVGHDARPSRSLLKRFMNWANKPVPKLDYRRDKRGRFRKVRRW